MSLNQPDRKFKYEIMLVERVAVVMKPSDYAVRLARVAEALYPFLTSSESLEKSVTPDGIQASSIHLHEQPTAGGLDAPEKDVSDGKDEPKTAA